MTESPKPPPRQAPRAASAKEGPPPPPQRGQPSPPAAPSSESSLTREPARDTLAPSSFGVIGGKAGTAPAPTPMRAARAPLPTLGDLEGATATATLRPPGAVPPPPRALPTSTPHPDTMGGGTAHDTPLPRDEPAFPALAPGLAASPRAPRSAPTAAPAPAPHQPRAQAGSDASLESTLDMSGSASKKATQAALIEQSRPSKPTEQQSSAVPAPGLFIADEPLEPRPKQPSLVTAQRQLLTRMRSVVLVLGGLLLMLLGALVVLIFRRTETASSRAAVPSASAVPQPAGCRLALPPSRISPIERGVPIAAQPLGNGTIALGIADSKTSAAGWIYDPVTGETQRKLEAAAGNGDVSYVTPSEPLGVDRSTPDFAFARSLSPGLAIGVGPSGILRRGSDGATGVVWPLATGVRVTPPRVVSSAAGHFVSFRQGGAEGQLMTGWLRPDGSALAEPAVLHGTPKTVGTPNVAAAEQEAILLFAARHDKTEPYRVHAARAAYGRAPSAVQTLDLPADGGGAIAPSLAVFSAGRFLVQWTDGNVGKYRVQTRLLDAQLKPLSEPLQISAKGANAGQGTIVAAGRSVVSFFIQTTAGHDELWGATLSCQ